MQRVLSAKNLSHAKAGTILAGYMKIFPMWLIVFPGMVARILFPSKLLSLCANILETIVSSPRNDPSPAVHTSQRLSLVLITDTVGCADPAECKRVCNQESGCTNIAYPMLVLELMPIGK